MSDSIPDLLSKFKDYDPDNRQMAISDLSEKLEREGKTLSDSLQRRVLEALVERLKVDANSNVKSIAVACLAFIITTASKEQVQFVCSRLCGLLVSGEPELRDVFATGLQKVLSGATASLDTTANEVVGSLVSSVGSDDVELDRHCLVVMEAALVNGGASVAQEQLDAVKAVALKQLTCESEDVRVAATACLSALSGALTDESLEQLVNGLITHIASSKAADERLSSLQAIGAISRRVAFRLGAHVKEIVPLLLTVIESVDGDENNDDAANDLRERCLNSIETFIVRCPGEVAPYLGKVLEACIPLVSFDPNYEYPDEDMDVDADSEEDSDEDEYSDYDVSDDDDTSWKARRAAIQAIGSIIRTRPQMLRQLYDDCGMLLITRFKEREPSVQLDVFKCFSDLLTATVAAETAAPTAAADGPPAPPSLVRQRSSIVQLADLLEPIFDNVSRQLRKSSTAANIKVALWVMLQRLARVAKPDQLVPFVDGILPIAATDVVDGDDLAMRAEALTFVRLLLTSNNAGAFDTHLEALAEAAGAAAEDAWSKLSAEAYAVMQSLAFIAKELGKGPALAPLLNAKIETRLGTKDLDRSVKSAVILAAAAVFAHLGNHLPDVALARALPFILERLNNEFTRLAALRAIEVLSASSLGLNLKALVPGFCAKFSEFLRLAARSHRVAAVNAMRALLARQAAAFSADELDSALGQLGAAVSPDDTDMCASALTACAELLDTRDSAVSSMVGAVLPAAVTLVTSPLLQGAALEATRSFFARLSAAKSSSLTVKSLLARLNVVGDSRKERSNIASCVAAVAQSMTPSARSKLVTESMATVASAAEAAACQALMNVGEVGCLQDLIEAQPRKFVPSLLSSAMGEGGASAAVQEAASFALGGVILGSPARGMGLLLPNFDTSAKVYPALCVVSDLLSLATRGPGDAEYAFSDRLCPVLMRLCDVDDSGTAQLVAKCIGTLAHIDAAPVFEALMAKLATARRASARATAVHAVRHAAASPLATQLVCDTAATVLSYMDDSAIDVRTAAVDAFRAITKSNVKAVRGLLLPTGESKESPAIGEHGLLGLLYTAATPVPSHKRKVQMATGYNVVIDDGLELRKAAFRCLETVLEQAGERVDGERCLEMLTGGLLDSPDVQLQACELLTKLCQWRTWQGQVAGHLDYVGEALAKYLKKALKRTKKKSPVLNDNLRAVVRAVASISALPTARSGAKFAAVIDQIASDELTKPVFAAETAGTDGQAAGSGAGAGAGAGAGSA